MGLADAANGEVILFGETRSGLVSGLTPGGRYHLDGATPGAMTETAPNDKVRMGIAKLANVFFVDVDTGSAGGAVDAMPFILGWEQGVGNLDLEVAEYFSLIPPACRLTSALGGGVGAIAAPSEGSDVEIDVLRNGVSVFSSRPSWAARTGAFAPGALTGAIAFNGATDVLSVEISTVGVTVPGGKLLYTLRAERV